MKKLIYHIHRIFAFVEDWSLFITVMVALLVAIAFGILTSAFVVQRLVDAGAGLSAFNVMPPRLEDAFLTLTDQPS